MRKKDKRTNKENGKHKDADSLLHGATCHTSPNFKKQGVVVPEKSVTKILFVKKKNGQIKGLKNMSDESLLHNTSSHTQYLYQISKSKLQQFLRNL